MKVNGHDGARRLRETEERVAALAARGRTNQEIADALHLSPKTVEWNLTKIYRVLSVRSRTELALRWRSRDTPGFSLPGSNEEEEGVRGGSFPALRGGRRARR